MPELLGGIHVELLARQIVYLLFQGVDVFLRAGTELAEGVGVDRRAIALDNREHADERQVDVAVHRRRAVFFQFPFQHAH